MSKMPSQQTTSIATSTASDVFIRDRSLCQELIGQVSFTDMICLLVLGKLPTATQRVMVDACLVTLAEHGITPSAAATRLTYTSAPEAMQGAVAAGLLGVGSMFVGSMDGCAALLRQLRSSADPEQEARAIVVHHKEQKTHLPGFGHPQHKPDDPRALRLFELAKEHAMFGDNCNNLHTLSRVVDEQFQRHITINATGAIAAVLSDCEVPYEIVRGFAIIARAAGLVGHIREEQTRPALRAIWDAAAQAVSYDGQAGK